jgi:hypothetical protein
MTWTVSVVDTTQDRVFPFWFSPTSIDPTFNGVAINLPKVSGFRFFNPLAISDVLIRQPTCFVTMIMSFQQNGVSQL